MSRDCIPLMQSEMMMQLDEVNMLRANKITQHKLYILNLRKEIVIIFNVKSNFSFVQL